MDALQPHDNLQFLSIEGFCGKEVSAWVMSLHSLVTLNLRSCCGCADMPPLSGLRSLKNLSLVDIPSMLTIVGSVLYDRDELFFPSLETLSINRMPNLKGWWLQSPTVLPTFPRVIIVDIRDCPKLMACMPLFPLVENLNLENVGGEFFMGLGIGNEAIGHPFHNGSCRRYLSSLQKLQIEYCEELETMSWRGLAYLTSLQKLSISDCTKLQWVDGCDYEMPEEMLWGCLSEIKFVNIPNVNGLFLKGLRYMPCLQHLTTHNFNFNLNEEKQSVSIYTEEEDDGMPWKALPKLEILHLEFGETLSLKGLENLTSLRELSLSNCIELHMSWRALLYLNHLQKLEISDAKRIVEVDFGSSSSLTIMIAPQIQSKSNTLKYLGIERVSVQFLADIPWKSFATLESLNLTDISDIEALPDGIQHLHALKSLDVDGCKRVVSLPSWMSSLSSLQSLNIWGCSRELKKRCERGIGEDWPLIHHIPYWTIVVKVI